MLHSIATNRKKRLETGNMYGINKGPGPAGFCTVMAHGSSPGAEGGIQCAAPDSVFYGQVMQRCC